LLLQSGVQASRRASLLIACGLALRVSAAAGQVAPVAVPEPPASEPAVPLDTHWYGWEMLLTDGAGFGVFALGMGTDANENEASFPAVVLGLGTLAFSGPMIHAGHGSWAKAGYSFALRAAFMSLGAAIGMSTRCDYAYDHEGCPIVNAIYGTAVGGGIAAFLDAVLFGHERVVRPTGNDPILGFVPLRGGGGLSFVGRF
jgi:hypothetical protein